MFLRISNQYCPLSFTSLLFHKESQNPTTRGYNLLWAFPGTHGEPLSPNLSTVVHFLVLLCARLTWILSNSIQQILQVPLGTAKGVGSGGHHKDQDTALAFLQELTSRQEGQLAFTYSSAKSSVRQQMLQEQKSSSRCFHLFFKTHIFHWAWISIMELDQWGRHPRKREVRNKDTGQELTV